MKNSQTMHLRLSDSLNVDLEEHVEELGTTKSKLTRELIEKEIYQSDNILSGTDRLPKDSPFYALDFLRLIIFIFSTNTMFRTSYSDVRLWDSILKRYFNKLDSKLQRILMPVVTDFDRLLHETLDKPDKRHYYMFDIDRIALSQYIRSYVNLNMY